MTQTSNHRIHTPRTLACALACAALVLALSGCDSECEKACDAFQGWQDSKTSSGQTRSGQCGFSFELDMSTPDGVRSGGNCRAECSAREQRVEEQGCLEEWDALNACAAAHPEQICEAVSSCDLLSCSTYGTASSCPCGDGHSDEMWEQCTAPRMDSSGNWPNVPAPTCCEERYQLHLCTQH